MCSSDLLFHVWLVHRRAVYGKDFDIFANLMQSYPAAFIVLRRKFLDVCAYRLIPLLVRIEFNAIQSHASFPPELAHTGTAALAIGLVSAFLVAAGAIVLRATRRRRA